MQSLFVNWPKVLGKNHNVIFEGVTSTYAKQTCSLKWVYNNELTSDLIGVMFQSFLPQRVKVTDEKTSENENTEN